MTDVDGESIQSQVCWVVQDTSQQGETSARTATTVNTIEKSSFT